MQAQPLIVGRSAYHFFYPIIIITIVSFVIKQTITILIREIRSPILNQIPIPILIMLIRIPILTREITSPLTDTQATVTLRQKGKRLLTMSSIGGRKLFAQLGVNYLVDLVFSCLLQLSAIGQSLFVD